MPVCRRGVGDRRRAKEEHVTTVPVQRAGRIYLTGFMGSGKTTVGPILANTIGYDFIDLDDAVESWTGLSVASIFRERGEEGFRGIERDVLRSLSLRERIVVALGGGALTDAGSLAIASTTGIVVYLHSSLEQIVSRLKRKSDRPLLLADDGLPLNDRALRERIGLLLESREPTYRRADIIVDTDGSKLGLTVDAIVRKLAPYLPR